MRRTLLLVLVGVLLLGFALAGCGSDPQEPNTGGKSSGEIRVFHVNVEGRQIPCIQWIGYSKGGLSCDWNAQ